MHLLTDYFNSILQSVIIGRRHLQTKMLTKDLYQPGRTPAAQHVPKTTQKLLKR